jgi:hypothetical protein
MEKTISGSVIPEYEKELTEGQESVIQAVIKDLNDNEVKDEVVRGRILAQHKSFALKCYVAGISSRSNQEVEETE